MKTITILLSACVAASLNAATHRRDEVMMSDVDVFDDTEPSAVQRLTESPSGVRS